MHSKRISFAILGALALATPALAEIDSFLNGFCDANTFDTEQCACTKTVFADEISKRDLNAEEAEMTALFLGQTGLDMMVFAEAMQTIDRTNMPKIIPIVGQMQAPIYQTCVEVDANSYTATETEVAERYLQACIFMSGQDEEEKQMCACQRDAIASQFDDDTFLLITELTEVEASGSYGDMDPMEYVLKEQRGLTNDEATDLLLANQGAMVAVPAIMLSCAQEVMDLDVDLEGLMNGMIPMGEGN